MTVRRTTSVSAAVETTIKALKLRAEDAAAVQLARKYAEAIDSLGADQFVHRIGIIGPSLLKALQALGGTPDSRAVAAKGGAPDVVSPARAALDELRARRARPDRAEDLDSTA